MCCNSTHKCQNHENSIKLSRLHSLAKPGLPNTRNANHLVSSCAQKIRQKYFDGASKGPGLSKDSIFAPSKPQASNIWAIFACKPRLNLFKTMRRSDKTELSDGATWFPCKIRTTVPTYFYHYIYTYYAPT